MQKYQCLVCGREMVLHHKIIFMDYSCNTEDDHHFSWRIKDNSLAKLRVRFMSKDEQLYLKIHYDDKCSEVWSRSKPNNRIKINQIVVPDFMDLDKLKNKIRMLLVFS
jgi:hypothetical protein